MGAWSSKARRRISSMLRTRSVPAISSATSAGLADNKDKTMSNARIAPAARAPASPHAAAGAPIKSVSSRLVRMPLENAASFATRSVTARDYVLVKITTTAGLEGIGLTYAGSLAGSVVQEAVDTLLAPLLVGQEAYRIEGLWERMYRESLLH